MAARQVQLDGLRWFAVLGVMLAHYSSPMASHVYYSGAGRWGVQLFFVLSGFLIGGILLEAKARIARGATLPTAELKNFYARRTLRIFPAYYLLLAGTFILGNWRSDPYSWMVLYAVNIWEVLNCEIAGIFGHLYTLCIEEHFYLFFPIMVLLVPASWVRRLFLCLIVVGIAYRLVIADLLQFCNGTRLVFAELDSLAAGALVASLVRSAQLRPGSRMERQFKRAALLCGILYFVNFYSIVVWGHGINLSSLTNTLFTVFASWLVYKASIGFGGGAAVVLSWKPFVYLGTISYGIYLYHNFAEWFVANAAAAIGWADHLPAVAFIGLQVMWTICVAIVSWYIVEQPCNRMKRYFEHAAQSPS